MRRSEIIEGIRAVETALKQSGLIEILQSIMEEMPGKQAEGGKVKLVAALQKYLISARGYNVAAKKVAKDLQLTVLEEPDIWKRLIAEDSKGANIIYGIYRTVTFAQTNVPKLIPLLEQESVREFEQGVEGSGTKYKGMRVLTITLYEDNNAISSPARIVNAIESINHFYYACAMMNNESPTTISVVACDSGSDKSFDFLGLAKVMECVERILEHVWERVSFFTEPQRAESLDLVAKSLPIIKQISQMKEQNEIDPELARLLNNNIIDGVNKFVQSGASTPKIENASNYNPRALLSPVQRLLVSAPEDEAGSIEGAPAAVADETNQAEKAPDVEGVMLDGLTPEEQETLRRLIGKATSRPTSAPSHDDNTTNGVEPPDDALSEKE